MKALIALVYIVTSVLAPIMGWLYPGDTEQATAQPFLADSLEQTLLPGQALWVRLGRMLTGQPETALDFSAAVAVGAGLLSLLATAHRAYGHRGLFGAAVVGLTVPMSWGLTAHSGPEAFIFFAIAFVLFASTFSNTSRVGTGLGITALTWGLLSWTYGFILWLAWFVLELIRHTSGRSDRPGTLRLTPVHIRALLPLMASPVLFIWCWPYLSEDVGQRLLSVFQASIQKPYPEILISGAARSLQSSQTPNIITGLALCATAFPLAWVALSMLGVRVARCSQRDAQSSGPAVMSLGLLTLAALNGGPRGLPIAGASALLPTLIVMAGIGLSELVMQTHANPSVVTRGLGTAAISLVVLLHASTASTRALDGPRHLGTWTLQARCVMPYAAVDGINNTTPKEMRLHVISSNADYKALVNQLLQRRRLRRGIQQTALFKATHVLYIADTETRSHTYTAQLGGIMRIEIERDGTIFQLFEL